MKPHIAQQTPAPSPQMDTCKLQSQSPNKREESRDHSMGIMLSTNHLLWSKTTLSPERKGKKKTTQDDVYIYAYVAIYA